MRKIALLFCLACTFTLAQTVTYEVVIKNITKRQIFSPPIVISHHPDYQYFSLGSPASEALAIMAEDGNAGPLADEAMSNELVHATVVGEGPVMPGQSATLLIETDYRATHISVGAMLITTNDAFMAVNGLRVPGFFAKNGPLRTRVTAEAYDAGSEANTEDCDHIPGPPCGNGGVRVTDDAEGYIYLHSGIHGIGDVSAAAYDWRSFVAVVEVRLVR